MSSLETHQKIAEVEAIIEREVKYCRQRETIEKKLIEMGDALSQQGFHLLSTLSAIEVLEKRILPDRHRRLMDSIYILQNQ